MDGEQHKLAAILFADIVGYSLLPEGVALRFRSRMLEAVEEHLSRHRGRLVNTQGDDILAEFASATDAVNFAMDLQGRIAEQNAAAGMGHRFRLRVGVHVGEVVIEGEDILGDAVNTAKRTESLAAPGGICMTESVWQEVLEQLPRPTWRLGRISTRRMKVPLVSYHLDPPGAGWTYRVGHRFRLALIHSGTLAALLILAGSVLLAALLLVFFGEKLLPRNPAELLKQAQASLDRYDQEGNVDRAIEQLTQVKNTDPAQFADAQGLLALAYWRRYKETGDLKTRTDAFNTASNILAINGEVAVAHRVQGLVAQDKGDLIVASNNFSRASALKSLEDGLVLINLADVCRQLHNTNKADEYIQLAGKVREKNWQFYNELAKYNYTLRDYQAALVNGLKATLLSRGNSVAECNVALFYLDLDDYTNHFRDAWQYLEEARKSRKTAVFYHTLGNYYFTLGQTNLALTNFELAVNLKSKDYGFWGTTGQALKAANQTNEANELLSNAISKAESILSETPDCVVRARLGLYKAAVGRFAEALRDLQQALEDCPDNSIVRNAAIESLGKYFSPGKEYDALEQSLRKP